jgi:glucan biosynthesis protein C
VSNAAPAGRATGKPHYVYLDVLRALAVLLLVLFHATGFLILRGETTDFGRGFRYFVHVFHMPLFFVLSGFVLGLATRRSGSRKQIVSRAKRLGIPFAVAMVTVIPAIKLVGLYFTSLKPASPHREAVQLTFGNVFSTQPQHLWFLEYLLFISVGALLVWTLWRRSGQGGRREQLIGPAIAALLVVPIVPVVLAGGWETGYRPDTMVPDLGLAVYYSCFLVVGWLISTDGRFLRAMERRPGGRLLLGFGLATLSYLIWRGQSQPLDESLTATRVAVVALSTGAAWLVISGLWGLFARIFREVSARARFFADSSYWLYIVHLPILVLIESGLARTSMPLLLRWIAAIVATVAICTISYGLLVRGRWIGRLLGDPAPPRNAAKPQESFASVGSTSRGLDSDVGHANETEPGSARAGVRAGDGARTAPP